MYQKVILIGRTTEIKKATSQAGNTVVSFGLAVQPSKDSKTEWFNCSLVGKFADTIANILNKGQLVFVEAQASTSEGSDGKKYTTYFVSTLRILNDPNHQNGNTSPSGEDAPF